MFNFENKPVKNWTLAEAKEYCETKLKDEDCCSWGTVKARKRDILDNIELLKEGDQQ